MSCFRAVLFGGLAATGLAFGSSAYAFGLLGNEVSVGMAAPSPTGLSVKFWTSRETAIDVFAEWSASNKFVETHADYLTHNFEQFELEGATMPMYYGIGARIRTTENSSTHIGFRIPVGVSYLWNTAPLDLFAEIAPRSNIIPKTSFSVDVMIGVRYRLIP
jgi:hypothetical protein